MAMKQRERVFFPVIDNAIAVYLRSNSMTQAELAAELGMSEATLSAKRKGDSEFTYTEMVKLCDLLGLSLDEARRGVVFCDKRKATA